MNEKGRSHQTITARVSYWSDDDLLERVLERQLGAARGQTAAIFRSGGAVRVWLERPKRCRSEFSGETAVADGQRAWRDFRGTKNVTVQDQGADAFIWCASEMFSEPASVLEGLSLTLEGEENVGGRRVVALRGIPRQSPDDSPGVSKAGFGDRHRILVDLETGLPVSIEALLEGKPLDRTTVDELVVGAPIPETFTYVPAPDARVLDDKALQPIAMSPSEADARLTFRLWTPAAFGGDVLVAPDLMTDTDFVWFPVGGAFPASVKESVATPLTGDGRRMVRDGTEILVVLEGPPGGATVALIRGGTRIEVSGSAAPEKLADLGLSFEPVSKP